MRSLFAEDCSSITVLSLSCNGFNPAAKRVSSRMTLRLVSLIYFGLLTAHLFICLSRGDSLSCNIRSKGFIRPATWSAMPGEMPLGRKLGNAVPNRWAPAAVASSMVVRCLARDGLKFVRIVRPHSPMMIREYTFTLAGSVISACSVLEWSGKFSY